MFTVRILSLLLATGFVSSMHVPLRAGADVTFYFYSQTSKEGILVDSSSLSNTDFVYAKPNVVLVHGWTNNRSSPSVQTIKDSYLKVADYNVFIVDWSEVASLKYQEAVAKVGDVAKSASDQIQALVDNAGLRLAKTTIIGHSLGAHIAGVTGANLGSDLSFVVGLDPAGPLFSSNDTENRLTSSDARFVQVIHTDAGNLGFSGSLGTADFWPNGGKSQPGCDDDRDQGSCSHARAYEYWAESLETGSFEGVFCDSWDEFLDGYCEASYHPSYFGTIHIHASGHGNYFLYTNSESPYAKGEER